MDYMDVMGLIYFVVSFGPIAVVSIFVLVLDWWKRKKEKKDDGD